jgi:hypothetical protein
MASATAHANGHRATTGYRRGIALVFVYVWAVYALVQAGNLVTSENYFQALHVAPRAAQGAAGDGYAQTLIKLERTLPAGDHVLLVWRRQDTQPAVGFWYGYFWATYWLYPRTVDIVITAGPVDGSYTTLLDVRSTGTPEIEVPAGFSVNATYTYPDQVVTVLRRDHA